jgi:hypothetical protein
MALVRIFACLLATLVAALPLPGAAAPFAVRLGIERIVLDTPPGFTDTTELASPRLQSLSETLTAASNKILIFALSDADVRSFTQGGQLDAKRYMIAVTPRGLEQVRVTPAQFAAFSDDSLQGLGKLADTGPDLIKFLVKQPIGKAHLLEELKKEPTAVSVMQAMRIPDKPATVFWESDKPQYLCFTTTLFLVRGKALQLRIFSMYDSPADTEWLKTLTQRWQDELHRLNK